MYAVFLFYQEIVNLSKVCFDHSDFCSILAPTHLIIYPKNHGDFRLSVYFTWSKPFLSYILLI